MSPSLARLPDYLEHIRCAIERIESYTDDMDEVDFLQNGMAQDAVIRNIEVIGEASNNVLKHAPEFAMRHGDIPWSVIYAMRNRVSHAYHKVDLDIVWKMVRDDLPLLRQQIDALIQGLTP